MTCFSVYGGPTRFSSSSKQAASSTREMGKNQNSVVVLLIWLKFWCMIPMGVNYNHTKFERETRRWRPARGFASGGPPFENLAKMARKCLFLGSLGA